MKIILISLLLGLLVLFSASSQTIKYNADELESKVMAQARKDFGDPQRFYLFTLKDGFESMTTKGLKKTNSTVFNYGIGFTLRFYLIGLSDGTNRVLARLYHIPFTEGEDMKAEPVLVKEFKETITDGSVRYFEYLMKSDDDHRLQILFENDNKACAVLVATVNNNILRRKTVIK